ncbi:hypothetical protein FC093_12560 [Ilyomonas limi]|uniref:Uncharacterized protein n=1 Tax=Ilyomonas limi TaxID=2575867 RepID=A0A4U3L1E3_9BACT|nr:hypothetical protein [Ilyomonas limi]TKK68039.1 hypothetical protein FC093_12560 [Ilyomonas limi]
MKYFIASIVFVFAGLMVQAQTNNPMLYTYRQKQLNDTLHMLFPDLQPDKEVPFKDNTPVLPLRNGGVKVGSSSLGDVYSMNVDKMPCLKPFATKDEMPNAVKLQPVLPHVQKEKE